MQDPKSIVAELERIITGMRDATEAECRIFYDGEASTLLFRLRTLTDDWPGSVNISQQLDELDGSMRALAGIGRRSGHPRFQQAAWGLANIFNLKRIVEDHNSSGGGTE